MPAHLHRLSTPRPVRQGSATLARLHGVAAVVLLALCTAAPPLAAAAPDPTLWQGLEYRHVGPFRGGRATAAAMVPGEPYSFYFGSTGGGLWFSDDAGETWRNVTDGKIDAGGIGAVAVAPSDANVIYLGTGSACIRGNVSPGVGAYRSLDRGVTWERIGLERAGQIGDIVVHPNDAETVWLAALGDAFGPNDERGVFRTTDGGATWQRVLDLGPRTGVVDLSLDASNPRVLYAAAWGGGERKSWDILSGHENGGIYKSVDGGVTWNKLAGGLPGGLVGKTAVEVSPADPRRVWALIEHEKGGLYRSDDGGASWRLINEDHSLWERPWYYMHITAHPQVRDTVYFSNVMLLRSVDGGRTTSPVMTPHPDNHGLWINPERPELMINVNDGGANVSLNGGRTWSTQRNQPTAELYRVAVDDQFRYRLYGAQQDNSTISVPSRLPPGMASSFEDEFQFGGCESGHVAVDPRDPDIIYAGCYGGGITRYDRETGDTREIVAYPQLQLAQERRDLRYRFQWNAPIRLSPHDPDVLYHTSQVVHRSRDQGHSWEVISPDLTTNDPEHQGFSGGPITRDGTGVEVYGTIFALEESPLVAGVLWAGSDDGRVHTSPDGGATWNEVTPPGLPEGATVNAIDLSRRSEGRAIVTAYRYREADFAPYAFLTEDGGSTWRSLTGAGSSIPERHFLRVVREDPEAAGLLYAGGEFGIYVSLDDGRTWQSLQRNLPVTPITDMLVHRGDLVLSTQGRSFWILDDLTPLRAVATEGVADRPKLLAPRPTHRLAGSGGFALQGGPRATDAPKGVHFDYFLPQGEQLAGDVTIEIADPSGEVVKTLSSAPPPPPPFPIPEGFAQMAEAFGISFGPKSLPKQAGHNRALWDLTLDAPKLPAGAVIFGFLTGPVAVPGTYTARFSAGDVRQEVSFTVAPDPRSERSVDDMEAQLRFLGQVGERIATVASRLADLRSVRQQIQGATQRIEQVLAGSQGGGRTPSGSGAAGEDSGDGNENSASDERLAAVKQRSDDLVAALTAVEEELVQTKSRSFEDPLNYPGKLTAQLAHLYTVANSGSDAPPTRASVERLADLDAQLAAVYTRLDEILTGGVGDFNALVAGIELPAVVVPPSGGN